MVPGDRVANACGANHAIWRKQAALCDLDGDQEGEDQRNAPCECGGPGPEWHGCCHTRKNRSAEEAEINADSWRVGEGGGSSVGGEAEDGGARAMSLLLVLEESGGKIKRASWEALAAALKLASAQDVTAVVIGAQTEAPA